MAAGHLQTQFEAASWTLLFRRLVHLLCIKGKGEVRMFDGSQHPEETVYSVRFVDSATCLVTSRDHCVFSSDCHTNAFNNTMSHSPRANKSFLSSSGHFLPVPAQPGASPAL